MNFGDCLRVLQVGIGRDDLRDLYPGWINQALRAMQSEYSWNCMRHTAEITVPSGGSSAALPSDFKELQSARPPVFMRGREGAEGAVWLPCDVRREEEPLRMRSALLHAVSGGAGPDVWMTVDGDRWYLNLLDIASGELAFRVKYFRFLPPLIREDDENDLLRAYEEMVTHKIKAVGFAATNDTAAALFETLFASAFLKAKAGDARRWVAGRRTQLGG